VSQETEHLAQANRHIEEFRQRVADQEESIAELERDGHPTVDARALLNEFMETLRLAIDHRDMIIRDLAIRGC